MGKITRTVWKCDRCKHEWLSRDVKKPIRCAKCKSAYWDQSNTKERKDGKK